MLAYLRLLIFESIVIIYIFIYCMFLMFIMFFSVYSLFMIYIMYVANKCFVAQLICVNMTVTTSIKCNS
jgi:hypothetical protein